MTTDVHYANLTNGVLCAPQNGRFTRIPSTFCEQKMWGRVVYGAGPDLLTALARGASVVVHDQSEKQRVTRAQWQGLSWLRYACSMAWGLEEPVELSRGGANVTGYWRGAWLGLDSPDKAWLRYFGRFAQDLAVVDLRPCDCPRQPWVHGDGRGIMLHGV